MRDALYSLPPANLPDTPETRRDMAAYKASARSLDQGVGTVLDAIERRQHARDPHHRPRPGVPGLEGDADRPRHRRDADHPRPGRVPGGKVSDALVSQIDLFPTICELAGIERPAWVRGRSLLPLRARPRATTRCLRRSRSTPRTSRSARCARSDTSTSAGSTTATRPVLAEHRRQPQQGLPARPRAGGPRRCRRRSCSTSSSIPTRRTTSSTIRAATIAGRAARAPAGLDAGDRRPAAATGRSSRRRARRSTCRPALAGRADDDGPDGARGSSSRRRPTRPPGCSATGRRSAGSRWRRSASTRDERLAGPARRPEFVVALGSGASAAGGGPAWVEREIEWLRAADAAALPGPRHLLRRAGARPPRSGGCVRRLARPEVGWVTVDTDDDDRVPSGPWLAWHEDGFTLPPLAYELASQRVRRAGLLPLPPPRGAVPPGGHAAIVSRLGASRSRRPRARRHDARGARRRHPTARGGRRASRRIAVRRVRRPGRARGCSLPRVKHEHTHHVAADADKVYAALADVSQPPALRAADDQAPTRTTATRSPSRPATTATRSTARRGSRPTTPSAGSSGAPRAAPTTAGSRSTPTRTARA